MHSDGKANTDREPAPAVSAPSPSAAADGSPIAQPAFWVAGLALGIALALAGYILLRTPPATELASADRAAIAAVVRETILKNPELIPEAINNLQTREVEKLLASNREAIETPYKGAWAGAADGDVVLVEFFDFNCPFCRQSAADVDRLLAEDPRLKLVFRDMPVLGPESERFARASLSAAGQDRYRKFYSTVFSGQGPLNQERLIRNVRTTGLNEAQVVRDMASADIAAELERNIDLGRALGLTGTPSYIVGNQILSGAVGYDALKAAIEEARTAGKS